MEIQLEKLALKAKRSEEGKIPRHCAFCLILLAEKDVKCCRNCKRRVYCGQDCQIKDWKSHKPSKTTGIAAVFESMAAGKLEGQGHNDWCGLPVCEEDLDWVVKEGGKGVVAKRLILKGERILVGNGAPMEERCASGAADMLFNHACDANSVFNNAMDYKVSIITASKDIASGTEITFNYIGFGNDSQTVEVLDDGSSMPINSFEDSRKALKIKYGITCQEDCFCYNKEMEEVILNRIKVTQDLTQQGGFGARAQALQKSLNLDKVQLLQNVISGFDVAGGNPVGKAQMICFLLNALRKPENRKYSHLIPNYEKEADEIFKSVFHPKSPYSKLEGWKNNSLGFGF